MKRAERLGEIKEERRSELLDAALELFSKGDFASVSVDAIARKAGVSKGTVYWYFPSKEDLLVGVIEREHGRIGRRLSEIAASDASAAEKLSAIVSSSEWLGFQGERLTRLASILASANPKGTEHEVFGRLKKDMLASDDLVAALMREASGTDNFRGFSYEEMAIALGSCLHGLSVRIGYWPDFFDVARMGRLVNELFIRPVTGSRGGEPPEAKR